MTTQELIQKGHELLDNIVQPTPMNGQYACIDFCTMCRPHLESMEDRSDPIRQELAELNNIAAFVVLGVDLSRLKKSSPDDQKASSSEPAS